MRLERIHELIQGSRRDDWHEVKAMGLTYRDRSHAWSSPSRGGGDWEVGMSVDSHPEHAVFRDDVNLALTWGMDRSWDPIRMQSDRRDSFDWSDNFPDPSVNVFFADVFWAGALVDREYLITVDGGRGTVPLGRTRKKPGAKAMSSDPADFYASCTQREADFARLIDELSGAGQDFDRYFGGTGYVIEG